MADTDRELLELAAKATGHKWKWVTCPAYDHEVPGLLLVDSFNDVEYYPGWNPLKDDGDALRLAVKLGISITPYPIYNSEARHSVIAKQRRKSDTLREVNPTEVLELYGDDAAAAWRRAIVRCAAEIGRTA